MDNKMFCYQCEQTAGCGGCTGAAGVCGKTADVAKLQDELTGALVALARGIHEAPEVGTDTWRMMIEGLLRSNIRIIEMGNAKGLGATEKGSPAPISDVAYLDLIHPYLGQAEIGMFLNAKRFEADNVAMAADKGISFLRLGADAGMIGAAMLGRHA